MFFDFNFWGGVGGAGGGEYSRPWQQLTVLLALSWFKLAHS